ncbi:MAG: 3-methyl-2-oxobutanoate dehydrogenase subunit VorB [Peptococcaceae bacterium]|jgi:2-oxoglutarate ferredoxin oxidoreductase subunit alpha|nr:3-methyl-2-oxobutanoate dehydrogenase subunit VorB [Peptococcaceae bacterium]MDH7524718.1 3-methyl-2-oxobutanoate dehydrogenase subunit VorB [Peptococcaceae bacterium]
MNKVLMKGNEAIGEAAIAAGCRYFFGYPITPQSELPEFLSRRLPQVGGVFLQAESEVAAINMVYGAASTGARVMTSSSSPGISLKQEGISYLAASELPCVIVNIMRAGPGLGGIQPSQSDYFQATRGGGHGDYRTIVLAPASVQEIVDLVIEGFELADRYRLPVMILGDGNLGQMMEPVQMDRTAKGRLPAKPWALTGKKGRPRNIINSLNLDPEKLEMHNRKLERRYQEIKERETKAESYLTDDAEIVVAAYGIVARVSKAAVDRARAEGIKAGLFRPITLWPFPEKELNEATARARNVLTVEMSLGQMVEDVKLALNGRLPAAFYGRVGGVVPTVSGVFEEIQKINQNSGKVK